MATGEQQDRASAYHRRVLARVSAAGAASDDRGFRRGAAPAPTSSVGRAAQTPFDEGSHAARSPDPDGVERALPGATVLAIAVVGLALGLSATALVLDRGWDPGTVVVGPWVARPRVGTTGIDPYARAELARSGAVPMAASEGMSFRATTDDTGYRLVRSCTYRLGGAVPPARVWTLTATDEVGRSMEDPAHRSAFTSATVLRDAAGTFALDVGPEARPGNWLPTGGAGPLTLTLRLYGTPLTGEPGGIAAAHLPAIVRRSCAASGSDPSVSPGNETGR